MKNEMNEQAMSAREAIEREALNAAPQSWVQDIALSVKEMSNDDLLAIIRGDVFHTDDGYLFVKHKGFWTDGDLGFIDKGGVPFDECTGTPLSGQFVLRSFDRDRYERIAGWLD
jgi:hypothetical protein